MEKLPPARRVTEDYWNPPTNPDGRIELGFAETDPTYRPKVKDPSDWSWVDVTTFVGVAAAGFFFGRWLIRSSGDSSGLDLLGAL